MRPLDLQSEALWSLAEPISYEPAHKKNDINRFVQAADSDQPARLCSQIRVLIACVFYSLQAIQREIEKTLAILGGCTG